MRQHTRVSLAAPTQPSRHDWAVSGPQSAPIADRPGVPIRPRVLGKFVFVGNEKLYLCGVTYGTFRPNGDGAPYPNPEVVEHDFASMAACGVNAVRTYTVPPRWLLDSAYRHGLRVMVGVPWEQHVAFLNECDRPRKIEQRARAGVRSCAGHPAVLCYAIGNEIPASIVRWYGRGRIERYLHRLYRAAKEGDPDGLVTYVNYPSTEYLQLPFLDLVCYNVYLESQDRLEAYLARLQNLAGERPLLLTELGLDTLRHGKETQARVVDWQIRTAFAGGCAGVFVFGWTDEWHRGGRDIDDWSFGLTRRDRAPKPGLDAVRRAFSEVPFPRGMTWPRVSVVVCVHNGARTLSDLLEGLRALDYPDFEVIVVDDGSTDGTAEIATQWGYRVIRTSRRGLAVARNVGLEAASGEIIAYIDADACPDPHWLRYLAAALMNGGYAGVGGPSVAPPGDGFVAGCVARAPGNPQAVLLSDREAEHIPGCNMGMRRTCLKAIGGFDARFRLAGDDVDMCWRLRDRGWKLGFSAGAVVWHHPRNSVRAFWTQQYGYGGAEALLEEKWPERYSLLGHPLWKGRMYSNGTAYPASLGRSRIYHGVWGQALFQAIYSPRPGTLLSAALVPESYLVIGFLVGISLLGFVWTPLFLAVPMLGVAVALPAGHAVLAAVRAAQAGGRVSRIGRVKFQVVTAFLHLLQPLARLCGRLRQGLAPWRVRGVWAVVLPRVRTRALWSETWQAPAERLRRIEKGLKAAAIPVARGSAYDRWELEVRGGMMGGARLRMASEEHEGGRQMLRVRLWPRFSVGGLALTAVFAALSVAAGLDGAAVASWVLGGAAFLLGAWALRDGGAALAALERAVETGIMRWP